MAITGRKPADCFNAFREHLGPVLAATLGVQYPVVYRDAGKGNRNRRTLTLASRSPVGVRLEGKGGAFFFSLIQDLEVFELRDKSWQLKTVSYQYAISETDDEMLDSVMRWDYVAVPPSGKRWCRNHFQVGRRSQKAVELPFNTGKLDLNRLHMPTGWVLIEEVLRFLLTDMEVEPASDDWEVVLEESREAFFEKFSRRTSQPPST